jgi:thioesterase domain-containing protein
MSSSETERAVRDRARIEALINTAFKREVIRKVTDTVLPLNDIGSSPPFYCVHSVGGVATEFRDMARMLGPKQKFYGIQVPTDKRNAEFGRSIRTMSKYYVDELMKFQPEGSFVLGGHSVGATIALEMSHQLMANGREVSLLVVFDGRVFNTGGEMSQLHPLYWLKLLLNVPRWIVDRLMNRRALANNTIARVRSAAFKRGKLRTPHALERFIGREGFLPGHAEFIRALYTSHLDYIPDHYPGRVVVFVAKTQAALLRLRQVKETWLKIAPSSEVFEIDGTHESIIRIPHGLPVAERLMKKIEELGKQSGATNTP